MRAGPPSASSATVRQCRPDCPSASGIGSPSASLESLRGRPAQRLLADQFEPRQALMIGDQREFERAGVHERGEFDRILADDRDLRPADGVIEAGQDVGEERLGVVVGDAEPHRALEPLARSAAIAPASACMIRRA